MESLLKSLRNLGLRPPESSQLLELLDDDPQVQERLAKILSVSSLDTDFEIGGGGGGNTVAALMGQELLQEAVFALLDNFRKTIQRQRDVAEQERQKKTKRIKWAPRKALLARQVAALQRCEKEREEAAGYRPRLVFDGSDSYCSTSKLSQLKRVECADLNEAPLRYAGCYLLCRVLTPLLLYAGVTFIVEDPSGAALPVSVSHFTADLNLTTHEVSQMLPIGTVLAIREPYVALDHQARAGPCSGKPDHGVRVDSPTDIIVLDESDSNAVQWTISMQRSESALSSWLGMQTLASNDGSQPDERLYNGLTDLIAKAQIGEAHRRLCRARQRGMQIDPLLEARLLYSLDDYKAAHHKFVEAAQQESIDTLKDELTIASDFRFSISKLTPSQAGVRCKLRQVQASQGLSAGDMRSIFFAAAAGVVHLDTSDFIGPVTVRKIAGAGRGLVTTRDVEPGELLLCCKAVCPTSADDGESKGSPLLRLHLENGVVSTTSQVRAQTRLIHAIVDRPELALPILGLTAGPQKPDSRYVSQEYPLQTSRSQHPLEEDGTRLDVDAAYVDGVLRFNAFGPAQMPSSTQQKLMTSSGTGELERSTMPHPLPAILNHACLPNVSSVFFSNIVTTRALSHLPAGTEIVHQYVKGEEPLAIRSANLSKHGFECACTLCKLDRQDGQDQCRVRARIVQGESRAIFDRSALLLRGDGYIMSGQRPESGAEEAYEDVIESLEALIERIQATYAASRGNLKPDLFKAMEARTRHIARRDIQAAVFSATEALASVGATVDLSDAGRVLQELPKLHFDASIALMLFIATTFSSHDSKMKSVAWTKSAFWAHECMIGGGIDVFLDRWGLDEFKDALDLQWSP